MKEEQVKTTVASATSEIGVENKFKDNESLSRAYDSLQAEFTKRCQRVKELEGEIAILKNENRTEDLANQKLEIIKEYLGEIKAKPSAKLIVTGESVKTPPKKPKTIMEASRLAKELFKKSMN